MVQWGPIRERGISLKIGVTCGSVFMRNHIFKSTSVRNYIIYCNCKCAISQNFFMKMGRFRRCTRVYWVVVDEVSKRGKPNLTQYKGWESTLILKNIINNILTIIHHFLVVIIFFVCFYPPGNSQSHIRGFLGLLSSIFFSLLSSFLIFFLVFSPVFFDSSFLITLVLVFSSSSPFVAAYPSTFSPPTV